MPFDLTAIPLEPPAEWFTPPAEIPQGVRVTIEDTGRVYGYIALWNACHVGMSGCTPPPKGSPSEYALAHTGQTMTAEGELVATANIGGGLGHYGNGTAEAAARYHGDVTSQLMRVRYGEDENGLWFAGALWPDVSEIDVQRLRSTELSGDWRWVNSYRNGKSGMEFTGSVLVNLPGFPLEPAGGVSTESGRYEAMVASVLPSYDHLFVSGGCVKCSVNTQPDGDCMCDCDKKKRTVAAIVEPLTPEAVHEVIWEVVESHAVATIEDLLSLLRPTDENAPVETADVEPDGEDVVMEEVAASLSKLSSDVAEIKAAVIAQSV